MCCCSHGNFKHYWAFCRGRAKTTNGGNATSWDVMQRTVAWYQTQEGAMGTKIKRGFPKTVRPWVTRCRIFQFLKWIPNRQRSSPFHPLHPHSPKPYRPPGSLGHKEETSADSMSWTSLYRREYLVNPVSTSSSTTLGTSNVMGSQLPSSHKSLLK